MKKGYKRKKGIKEIQCDRCETFVEVDEKTATVVCANCVVAENLQLHPEWIRKKEKNEENKIKKPKGWHWLKLYVDSEGNVYRKGKECPEEKGKFKPTVVKTVDRIKKKQDKRAKEENRARLFAEIGKIKNNLIKTGLSLDRSQNKREETKHKRSIKTLNTQLIKKKKELRKYL